MKLTHKVRALLISSFAVLGLVMPGFAHAAPKVGAVVFSKYSTSGTGSDAVVKGGLFAVREGRLNQLTEDPADTEPDFSPDGTTIAFARGGHIFSVRPDGSGQRRLTSGTTVDSRPIVSPNGRWVVFQRSASEGAPGDLYTVGINGGGLHPLTTGANGDSEAAVTPDGKAIVFVRAAEDAAGHVNDDLYSVRPSGTGLARLTTTARVDEFAPRPFAGGYVFSRGDDSETPAAYADVYTIKRNGTKIKPQVKGVGSAYVEDVSPDGHSLIFRRDQGLWAKRIGPSKARKLAELPDGSSTSTVFSSDGKLVAAFVEAEGEQRLVSISFLHGGETNLAEGFGIEDGDGTTLGPVIAWQPTPGR